MYSQMDTKGMDRQMNIVWLDGLIGRKIVERTDRCIDVQANRQMYIEKDRCTERRKDVHREGKMHREKERYKAKVESDKNMDRQKNEWGEQKYDLVKVLYIFIQQIFCNFTIS